MKNLVMNNELIESAATGSVARTIATLVDAFEQDPAVRWMYPDQWQFQDHFPEFVRAFGGAAFEQNTAQSSDDGSAAALWIPPGVEPDEDAIAVVLERSVTSILLPEVFLVIERMGRFHPSEPHWYLPMIGVESRVQGHGVGSALMMQGLQRCDHDRLPAYLESTNPRNQPFYERLGFEAIGRIQARSSPPIIPMIRCPKQTRVFT
jgi:GNAT superfamily N-acetyltransferase